MTRRDIERERAIQRLRVGTITSARQTGTDKRRHTAAVKAIHKAFGEDSLNPLLKGSKKRLTIPCISTGDQVMDDWLTGAVERDEKTDKMCTVVGSGRGIPRGRILELWGKEGSGKTTWMLMMVAAYQSQGYRAAYIDVEHALDPDYAVRLGVEIEALLISQPNSAEQGLEIARMLVSTSAVDLVVIDSVAALVPEAEQDGDIGDQHPGLQARLMSQALRMLNQELSKGSRTTVMFVNQTRMKILTGWMAGRGNPETTAGGMSLRFYASIRIRIAVVGQVKRKSEQIGVRSVMKTVKNKLATPFREIYVDITEGKGITKVHRTFKRA